MWWWYKLPAIELNRVGPGQLNRPKLRPNKTCAVWDGLSFESCSRPKSTNPLKLAQSKCVCFRLINLIKIRKCELPVDLITTNTQIRNINIYLFIKKIEEVNKFKKNENKACGSTHSRLYTFGCFLKFTIEDEFNNK